MSTPRFHCGMLVVLSGPSGVGKDALLSRMRGLSKPFHYTVTATTRPRRSNERDGVDYIFVTKEAFKRMIEDGELLEWAEVYGNLYGVPRSQVVEALENGKDVLIKADVQGAATIKAIAPDAVFIFLAPPTLDELAHRLRRRMTESPEALALRLKIAELEMGEAPKFDYVVVNKQGALDESVREIERIVEREGSRPRPRDIQL